MLAKARSLGENVSSFGGSGSETGMDRDCVVVGGGLSGLYTAWKLQQAGMEIQLLEARSRLGGRVLSPALPDGGARFDLGPAWVWPQLQPRVQRLVDELGLALFPQYITGSSLYEPGPGEPVQRFDGQSAHGQSFRLRGGAGTVTGALGDRLASGSVQTGSTVCGLRRLSDGIEVLVEGDAGVPEPVSARCVVLAAPPRVLAEQLKFEPALAEGLSHWMAATPTWMAGHGKFLAVYERPFWREQGLSGEVFSRAGPMTEIYDACSAEGDGFGLFGFYGVPAPLRAQVGRDALIRFSLEQLERLFGSEAREPLTAMLQDWSGERFTASVADREQTLAGHPEYGIPPEWQGHWDGRLILAASESASENGGYLEGALEAGEDAVERVGALLGAAPGREGR